MLIHKKSVIFSRVLISVLLSTVSGVSLAQEAQPGDACIAGQTGWFKNSSKTTSADGGNMLFCDGSTWQSLLVYNATGDLVLGEAGAITLPTGTTAEQPATPVNGMIRYNSQTNLFEVFENSAWAGITGAGATASDIFEVTGAAGSEVVSSIDGKVPYATSDFVFGSPQMADDGDATHDSRMFFDKSKGSFRAGTVIGTHWDDASVGTNSVVLGSGMATGASSIAMGQYANATGYSSMAFGQGVAASASYALATGSNTTASGVYSTAMGQEATASGDNSMAIGLGNATTTAPEVSGASSFGIFMGDQDAIDVASANTMALLGGDFIVGSYQLDDTATGNQDYRMFFDTSKGAFRAGNVEATHWNDANVGDNSFAIGDNTIASGPASIAMGAGTTASGFQSVATGRYTTASGSYSTAMGYNTIASGYSNTAIGIQTTASGGRSTAIGSNVVAGSGTAGDGAGDGSLAIGLMDDVVVITTKPTVTGIQSMGIFMGDQDAVNFAAANTLGLFGGTMVIDPAVPATELAASTGGVQDLELDVEGDIGAINYCDEDGNNCFTASSVAGLGTPIFEVTGLAGSEVVSSIDANVPYTTADFVFGSPQLADDADATHDARMFFDKSKNAFRAGAATGTDWDDANVGDGSISLGRDTRASGYGSIALGRDADALGSYGMAFGAGLSSSGYASVAIGQNADTAANNSMAIGLGDAIGTNPVVSGANSLGIFMGDQNSIDMTSANTMALLGGDFIVGSYQLDDTTTGLQDNRMFFDTSKGAFRAGSTDGAEWDDASIGNYSMASGFRTTASGEGSFATGHASIASGGQSVVMGRYSSATNVGATAIGYGVTASGNHSKAFGTSVTASGIGSMALGMADDYNFTNGVVSGQYSLGIFMGDQDGAELVAANTMGLFGGTMVIDPAVQATELAASTGGVHDLELDVEGQIGAINYCDEDGNNCFAASTVASLSSGAAVFEVTGAALSEVVSSINGSAPYTTADFVFGSPQLADDADPNHDARMFFDKSKHAFRAGSVLGTEWDDANVGIYSAAFGRYTMASGNASFAVSYDARATGANAIAMGDTARATANSTVALGQQVGASGTNSFAFGLGSSTGTNPVVSGTSSFGIFMGDQSGIDITAANTMSIMGGEVGIGTVSPESILHVYRNEDVNVPSILIENDNAVSTLGDVYMTLKTRSSEFSLLADDDQELFAIMDRSQAWPTSGRLVIDGNGDVGIGTVNPSSKLTISGNNDDIDVYSYNTSTASAKADVSLFRARGTEGTPLAVASGDGLGSLRWSGYDGAGFTYGASIQADVNGSVATNNVTTDIKFTTVNSQVWNERMRISSAGNVGIGDFSSNSIDSALHLEDGDIRLDGGAGNQAGCLRFNDTSDVLEYSHDCSTYTELGVSSGAIFEVTGAAGSEVVRAVNATAPHDTADFVFGSTQLADTGDATDDFRMFFDKSKAAFRAGGVGGTFWDDTFVGLYSLASGFNTRASGEASTAMGSWTNASNANSTAMGMGTQATGSTSTAIGSYTTASGQSSTAMGSQTIASGMTSTAIGGEADAAGDYSVAIGLGNQTGGNSVVSGASSFGIFMGDQAAAIDVASANTMALLGGDFIVGSYQLDDTATGNQDHRMFFDASKSAFRAGGVAGTQWDDANVGYNSIAMGYNTTASGDYGAMAVGRDTIASGASSFASGNGTRASNVDAFAIGYQTTASGLTATAMGSGSTASGARSMAIGNTTTASGDNSFALGRRATAAGNTSVAFGLIDGATTVTTHPVVSGSQSFGIFMGDQEAVDVTAASTMGLFGGTMVIDPAVPATELAASTGGVHDLELDVEGQIGAINYCDEDGNNCFVASDVVGLGTPIFEVTGLAGSEVVSSIDANVPYTTADFVFGSPQLADDADANHRSRMFFDKSKAAFRAGYVTGTQWDDANVGDNSFAIGINTTASNIYSTAMGSGTIASGSISTAMGFSTTASGQGSTATGGGTIASGSVSTAMGNEATASGNYSMALGLGVPTTTAPAVSGASSFGIFMGDQTAIDVAAANTMALLGGDLIVGSYQLDDDGNAAHRNRMFFNRTKGAFRAGYVDGTTWNDANVGNYSVALGRNTTASGDTSTATGSGTTASGSGSTAMGYSAQATGSSSTAIGRGVIAAGYGSIAMGKEVRATGIEYTAAIGLADQADVEGTRPQVSGSGSMGIFMDTVDSYDLATTDTFGIIGGEIMIDDDGTSAATKGCIRYDDTAGALQYSHDCSTYTELGVSSGAIFEVTGAAGSELVSTVDATSPYATSDFVFGSPQMADNTVAANDSRMFFDKSKSAFRAGNVGNDDWDDVNVGDYSAAFGYSNRASGNYSTASGNNNTASGLSSIAIGSGSNTSGSEAISLGRENISSGDQSTAIGRHLTASGDRSLALGGQTVASGNDSTAMGKEATASGDFSFAISLADQTGNPQVSGIGSMGIFMGDQSNMDMTASNTMALIGGDFIVGSYQLDDTASATGDQDNRMFFDVSKGAFRAGGADGTQWDDANVGTSSFAIGSNTTASGLNSVATGWSTIASGTASTATGYSATASGTSSTAMGQETTASGNYSMAIGLGDATTTAPAVSGASSFGIFMGDQDAIDVADANTMALLGGDFIVGSYQLDDTATGNQDSRMFFDVSKGAFRAGIDENGSWSDVNVGDYSVALGVNTIASSNYSVAMGESTTASSSRATAMGYGTTASGANSTSMGLGTTSSGLSTVAMGQKTVASGANSMAIGLGDTAGTHPEVSGASSMGIFMGDQSGVDVTTANVMAIMGGNVGIGMVNPDAELDVEGDIEYTGTLTDMSDRRLKTDIQNLPQNQLDKIAALQGVSFKMKNDTKERTELGFIAQDVQTQFPDLVIERNNGMLSLNYTGLMAPMVEAIKTLKAENDDLRSRIEKLEAGK